MLNCLSGHAQQPANPPSGIGIYSCVDSRGRTITADRPIADCVDREQRELNPSGTTRRKVDPTLTAREQAERDERDRQAAQAALRAQEERRRERALLIRYPTPAAHDRDRADALTQINVVIQAAKKRLSELAEDRKKLDEEMEFYSKDLSKAPGSVRRQMDDIAQSVAVQNRFIADQEDEKKRVNARFDEERARLSKLWPTPVSTPAAKAPSTPAASTGATANK
ncbi:DUF4124 domain-containing protein [Variovorax sp. J22R133]|uniref:DUF4124 domain-containing protein n=1 Tax=Variovorax brevis TaxID=3053503 RepID=UPI002578BD09|nr:DUF4124 domain-containing protein [Variovorax sp. J22R133]MDM0117396.1 DUF4124 domain-containing protein [Variovorax sp. J22R133]